MAWPVERGGGCFAFRRDAVPSFRSSRDGHLCLGADPIGGLSQFPGPPTAPALQVTRCADEPVLQPRLGQAPILTATQAVAAGQFADRSLAPIAVLHVGWESVRFLFLASGLDAIMVLPDDQRAVRWAWSQAGGTLPTDAAQRLVPLEAVHHGACPRFLQPATVRADLSSRTDGPPLGYVDIERLGGDPPFFGRRRRHRPLQFPALRFRADQLGSRRVPGLHV